MTTATKIVLVGLSCCGACHRATREAPAVTASRSVFTDSAFHAQMCEAPRPGEDWRTSCQPKDQKADLRFMVKPPR